MGDVLWASDELKAMTQAAQAAGAVLQAHFARLSELGVRAKRAIELAESLRDRVQEKVEPEVKPEVKRNPAQAAFEGAELDANESWDSAELTAFLRLPLLEDRLQLSRSSTMSLSGPILDHIADASLEITRPRVWHETEARNYQVLLAVDHLSRTGDVVLRKVGMDYHVSRSVAA